MIVLVIAAIIIRSVLVRSHAPARHAVSSEELRKAMQGIGRASGDATDGGFDASSLSRTKLKKITEAAEATAKSASLIPAAARKLDLSKEERDEFEKLATKLHDQAKKLGVQARGEDVQGARETMAAIKTTCNSCHERFRVPPETPTASR